MNANRLKLDTWFGPETRFDLDPFPAAPFRGLQDTELERLKDRLLTELLNDTTDGALWAPYRRAANDAASLAWTTSFPLLFFPTLFEEKAREVVRHFERQQTIRNRDRRSAAVAA